MVALQLVLGLVTLAICLFARKIGHGLRLLDVPSRNGRKHHARVTPLVGGLAVVVPLVAMAVFLTATTGFAPLYTVLALTSAAFLVLGLVDDRRSVPPAWRLLLSVAICLAGVAYVPGLEIRFLMFDFLPETLFLDEWSLFFTILCLVGLQNAINMADGKNGLVIGMSLIWVVLLAAHAPAHVLPLLLTLGIGLSVALVFNLRGLLFLGDSGTYGLSTMLGLTTIYVYNVNFTSLPAELVALWFLVPVLDCIRLMVTRVLSGRSPFSPDRNHLHHILMRLMPPWWGLASYLAAVGLPCALAFLFPDRTMVLAAAVTACYGGVIMLRRRDFGAGRAVAPE